MAKKRFNGNCDVVLEKTASKVIYGIQSNCTALRILLLVWAIHFSVIFLLFLLIRWKVASH
ncbi:hypothetical protein T09_180 [Trichinella sp. T9]|nr:hypothetical protein T09_180 [Trichinella sp. T9]